MKKRLLISFSGGRTSAYMTWWLLHEWKDRHNWLIEVVFANTGLEAEGTLFFVDECAHEWGINITWLEYSPRDLSYKLGPVLFERDEKEKPINTGWQADPKIVTYETASRKGEPFEKMIQLTGITSSNVPLCSSILKATTIKTYAREFLKWKKFYTAIGIRSDEEDRRSVKAKNNRLIYPFLDIHPTNKDQVKEFWDNQPFDLHIHPDEGNCINCWKKNNNLLIRNARRAPISFLWWQEMTNKYGFHNPRNTDLVPPFNFYRGNRSPADFIMLGQLNSTDLLNIDLNNEDDPSGCTESCEAF